ncbi:MAG TPA: TadE/TadG family type IV pilus assembly protein [Acetobacteraceae bacterium]|nr:TadE/TadG family type IV pilus assembly protein [Acetobacteraceae bacterium]
MRAVATWRRCRDLVHCRRSTAAIEFAMIVTPLLVLIFGFISVSAIFYTWSSMQNAAQYAAMLVSTGQVKDVSTGALSPSNTSATTRCSSTLSSSDAEYYACSNLPSWATFTVITTENCAVPSVEVSLSASASAAAIIDIFKFFSGETLTAQATLMKEGSCP